MLSDSTELKETLMTAHDTHTGPSVQTDDAKRAQVRMMSVSYTHLTLPTIYSV